MSGIAVESRFSILTQKNKKKPKKPQENGSNNANVQKSNAKGTQGIKSLISPLQTKRKPCPPPIIGPVSGVIQEDPEEKKKRKKKKKIPNQTSQWDEWKKKDDEYRDKEFEKSIEEVLAMSKLEAKRRIMVPKVISTATKEENENVEPKNEPKINGAAQVPNTKSSNKKKAIPADNIIDSNIKMENFKSLLQAKDDQIKALEDSLEKMKLDMKQIKMRNKTLCTIISEGELKSKADLVLELENLTKVKDELAEQVNILNVELQQERSKVHASASNAVANHINEKSNSKDKKQKHRLKSESNS